MSSYADVVMFLPGIAGSTLSRDGRDIWGPTWSALVRAVTQHSLDELIIESETGADDLGDGIVASEVLDAAHVIPGLWKIDAYGDFCDQLCATVGLAEGRNFFRYPYDWRRDNRVSARRFAAFAHDRLRAWHERSGNAEARLVLVAHSMGGLVARYFIEALEGWRVVRRLVTLGTPHRGSVDALGFLVNGYAKGIGPVSVNATAPLRSFSSVYQLLPTYPCVESNDGLSRVAEASLPGLDAARVRDAATFHDEIAKAVEANRGEPGYPHGYLSAIVSSRQPTFLSARAVDGRVELLRTLGDADVQGDGTVPALSAIPREMDASAGTYVWGGHSVLANQTPVRESLIGALRAARHDDDRFRTGTDELQIALALEDVYRANVAFTLRADVRGAGEQKLDVQATPVDGGASVPTTLHRSGDAYEGPLALGSGMWRICVAGKQAKPAEDIALVLTDDGAAPDLPAR